MVFILSAVFISGCEKATTPEDDVYIPKKPVVDPPSGIYKTSIRVFIQNYEPEYTYYYTTDGSDPEKENSFSMSGEITLKEKATLKIRCVHPSGGKSDIASKEYDFSFRSVSMDDSDFSTPTDAGEVTPNQGIRLYGIMSNDFNRDLDYAKVVLKGNATYIYMTYEGYNLASFKVNEADKITEVFDTITYQRSESVSTTSVTRYVEVWQKDAKINGHYEIYIYPE